MGLLDHLRPGAPGPPPELLGCWHLVRLEGQEEPGEDADMEFRPGGELIYVVDAGDRWQVMRLTYRVEGDTIVSDQPSSPREERTRFRFEGDGTLVLDYGGARSYFRRGERRAPEV